MRRRLSEHILSLDPGINQAASGILSYLQDGRDDDDPNEQRVLVQPMKDIPLIEDRPGVELVEHLAEHEGVEQDAAVRAENKAKGVVGGEWEVSVVVGGGGGW